MIGGQPPGAAAGGGHEPDIVVGGEGDEIGLDMGIAKISHVTHITSSTVRRPRAGTDAQATCTRQ